MDIARMRSDVAEALAEVTEEPAAFADSDNLVDLGLDSIRLMSLATRWRAAGFEAAYLDLAMEPTVAAWARRLDASNRLEEQR
ncbi:phosphopantetheine-binding protein [Dactylosporangium sp. NPDC051541]|uniref:phosphopantetheine-binding protein n=1 Tax=Dactylosporangium sp. NPDC051541 TaxID=3363977 RepID=UPI003787740A